jgi:ADP-heptose:LPS heptosyltransferase
MQSASNPDLEGFYARTRTARKLVVVDLGFLGDSIHLVPALWELKRHYPEAELHTVSARVGAEVLRLAPCVNKAWAFPLGSPSPPWWRHWDLIRTLRRQRFDLAFNFGGADRTIFLTALTGAKWRIAHAGGRSHFWNHMLVPNWVSRRSTELAVFEQRLEVLASCGMKPGAPRWELSVPEQSRQRARTLAPQDAIHFSINASTPLKEWPLAHWVVLAKKILARDPDLQIVATASANSREMERIRTLAHDVGDPRLHTPPPGLPIADLAAVLQECRLHVGADSGVLHLAMALGLPTMAIFRQYAGTSEWLPRGPGHAHVLAACPCANQKAPACRSKAEAQCLSAVTPEQVLDAIRPHIPAAA